MTPISSIICPCEHTPTEALKRHDKNSFDLVISGKLLYRLINRYNDFA